MGLRLYLLCLICLFGLTGCLNYMGIKSHSEPLDPSSLSMHQVYKIPTKSVNFAWWNRFGDPQLNRLVAMALCDSPDMQIAESRVRKAEHLAERAGAALWPTLNFNSYIFRARFSETGLVPPPFNGRTFNIGLVDFNFNYEFDFWGKNREMFAAQLSEACAAEADFAQARLVIATAVINTYFQVQSNMALRKNAQAQWQERKALLAIANDRVKHGIESDIPLKVAVSDEEAVRQMVAQYQQAEMLARHQLAVLIGKNPLAVDIVAKPFSYHSHHVALPDSLPANLLANRPDIFASRFRVEAASHQVNVAKARFFPDINLKILFSYQSVLLNRLFDQDNQTNAIGGAIDLPLFDAGARRADLRIRYAEYDLAVNEYNRTILQALNEVANQESILNSLALQIKSQSNAMAAVSRNYKLINSRYNHGITDYTQLLQIKGLLLQQQATLLALQARHLQAVVVLIKALGGCVAMQG